MTRTIAQIAAVGSDDDAPLSYRAGGIRTWRDWHRDVARLAEVLSARDRKRWALYASDSYEFSVGLFALWLTGSQPVVPPLNSTAVAESLRSIVDGALGEFPGAEPIMREEGDTARAFGLRCIDPRADLSMFTSGSSGEPKLVQKTLRQLDTEVATLDELWGAEVADRAVFATVSHQHIYGLLFKVLWPLATRRPFYAAIVRDPQTMALLAARHTKTVCVTSPAFLKRIPANTLESIDASLPMKVFSSGGLLATPVAHRIARRLPAVTEVYGSTETGGIAHRSQLPEEFDTAWTPLPGAAVRADDDGRLLVRSPHLPNDAWHLTGDRGELAGANSFRLGARIDRIVKVEEKRVSLAAIETSLRETPGISDCACVVHPGRRDMVCAVVALEATGYRQLYESGRRRYVQRLRQRLGVQFDRVTLPRKWRFLEELPANEQGKSSASLLLALFEPVRSPRWPLVTSIDCRSEREATLTLFVSRQIVYFEGHFPGMPVLPGIAQLFWVAHFARQLFGLEADWRQTEAIKFNRIVPPDTTVTLHLALREDRRRLQFSYAIDGATCSSGRFIQRG